MIFFLAVDVNNVNVGCFNVGNNFTTNGTSNSLFHVPLRKLAMVLTRIKPKMLVLVAMVNANLPCFVTSNNNLQISIKIIFVCVVIKT